MKLIIAYMLEAGIVPGFVLSARIDAGVDLLLELVGKRVLLPDLIIEGLAHVADLLAEILNRVVHLQIQIAVADIRNFLGLALIKDAPQKLLIAFSLLSARFFMTLNRSLS